MHKSQEQHYQSFIDHLPLSFISAMFYKWWKLFLAMHILQRNPNLNMAANQNVMESTTKWEMQNTNTKVNKTQNEKYTIYV